MRRGSCKWRRERLRHKAILGSIAKGRAGLGFFPSTHTNSAKGKERRQLIQEEVREGVEEVHYCKMVGLSQQGAWTRWEDVEKKKDYMVRLLAAGF